MGGLTPSQGRLFGAFLEAVLYGANVILILATFCLIAQQSNAGTPRVVHTGVTIVILAICTAHLVAVLDAVRYAFFVWPTPDAFYEDLARLTNVVTNVTYGIAVVVADGLMIHRVYNVFGKDWRIIVIPCSLMAATAAVWFSLVHLCREWSQDVAKYGPLINRLYPAAYILSFVTNVVITAMIIGRILWAMRLVHHLRPVAGSFHRRCLAYTLESGLLYPLSLLGTGILWFLKNDSLNILVGCNLQLLCMVPVLLSLQMQLNLSIYDATTRRNQTLDTDMRTYMGHRTYFRRASNPSWIAPLNLIPEETQSGLAFGAAHKATWKDMDSIRSNTVVGQGQSSSSDVARLSHLSG